jgi:hypothetical protein
VEAVLETLVQVLTAVLVEFLLAVEAVEAVVELLELLGVLVAKVAVEKSEYGFMDKDE